MRISSDAVTGWRRRCLDGIFVRTRAECRSFVQRFGLCYPFTAGPGGIPALFAVLATDREGQRWDWAWGWKDQLHMAGEAFYGRLFGGKPLLVDRGLLPAAFAASGRTGDDAEDVAAARDEGRLSPLAQRILQRLAEAGSAPALVLRRELLGPGGSKTAVERALAELQSGCFIAMQIEPEADFGHYYRWDLFARLFPAVVAKAAALPARAGAAAVLRLYLTAAGAADVETMLRLFPWQESLLLAALARLEADGAAVGVELPDGKGFAVPALVTTG